MYRYIKEKWHLFILAGLSALSIGMIIAVFETSDPSDLPNFLMQWSDEETIPSPLVNDRRPVEPRRFIYLSDRQVSSLYEQIADSNQPRKRIEGVVETTNVGGSLGTEIAEAELNANQERSSTTEFEVNIVTTRKLNEVISVLSQNKKIMENNFLASPSSDVYEDSLAGHTRMEIKRDIASLYYFLGTAKQYSIEISQEEINTAKDEIYNRFADEVTHELSKIEGFVQLTANWSVSFDKKNQKYVYRTAYISELSTSPLLEFEISKDKFESGSLENITKIIDEDKNYGEMKLTIFGSVIIFKKEGRGNLFLEPIAVYHADFTE